MFSFEGRIGRLQWWGQSILASILIAVGFGVAVLMPLLFLVWIPATIVLSWSISTRRLHDLGLSGDLNLLTLIPFIGSFILFVMCGFIPGNSGPNQYGYPGGYVPVQPYQPPVLQGKQDRYLPSHTAIHPSLAEANDRAWQGSTSNYR